MTFYSWSSLGLSPVEVEVGGSTLVFFVLVISVSPTACFPAYLPVPLFFSPFLFASLFSSRFFSHFLQVDMGVVVSGGNFNRQERRRDRHRSGSMVSMASMTSITSMASSGYWGTGGLGEPHRDTDLSLASENLTLAEIDGNVFRMSKDQVRWGGCGMPSTRGRRGSSSSS